MTALAVVGRLADLYARRGEGQAARRLRMRRAPEIQAALDLAPAGFLLLVGNSHAEGAAQCLPAGLAAVNAGVCGLEAPGCARLLAGLRFPRPPGLAVVFLGSNELRRDRRPRSAGALRRFDTAMLDVIERLHAAGSGRVVLAAVAPIGAVAIVQRDPAAVALYTARLHALAALTGAEVCDPFAGIGAAGLHADGLHLATYDGLARRVVALMARTAPAAAQASDVPGCCL